MSSAFQGSAIAAFRVLVLVFVNVIGMGNWSAAWAVPKASLPNREITLQVALDGTTSFFGTNIASNTATGGCRGEQIAGPSWGAHAPGEDFGANNFGVCTNDSVLNRINWKNNKLPTRNPSLEVNISPRLSPSSRANVAREKVSSALVAPGFTSPQSTISTDGNALTRYFEDVAEGDLDSVFPTRLVEGRLDGGKLVIGAKDLSEESLTGTPSIKSAKAASAKSRWNLCHGTGVPRKTNSRAVSERMYEHPFLRRPDTGCLESVEPMKDAMPVGFFHHSADLEACASYQGCTPSDDAGCQKIGRDLALTFEIARPNAWSRWNSSTSSAFC